MQLNNEAVEGCKKLYKEELNVEVSGNHSDFLMRLFVNKIIDRVLEDRKQGIIRDCNS